MRIEVDAPERRTLEAALLCWDGRCLASLTQCQRQGDRDGANELRAERKRIAVITAAVLENRP